MPTTRRKLRVVAVPGVLGSASNAVTTVVACAGRRAGLGLIGAHRLRHSAATAMIRAGGSLTEIGQTLRHACRIVE